MDLRILDLTQALAGPFASMMLADQGAEVIKIEPPQGDITRTGGPFVDDDEQKTHGGYFQSVNRNKRSIVLDLKSDDGKAAFMALVKDADIVIENYRAGVMDKLGLGYERLRAENPRLVYGCLNGFGDPRNGKSPYADWPALDVVAQAMGGIMSITGPNESSPTKVGPGIGDIAPAMFLAFGVLAAVHHARRSGEGQFVDVAMVDAVASVCERMVYQYSFEGIIPGPEGNHHPFLCPFGTFPAKDGFVTIAAPQDSFFETTCRQLNLESLLEDERFKKPMQRGQEKSNLIPLISNATIQFTKQELQQKLGGKVPFGPVQDVHEIANDPHFAAREMLVEIGQPGSDTKTVVAGTPVKMNLTPGAVKRHGPFLGEDTEEILREAGLEEDIIDRLIEIIPEPKRTKTA